MRPLRLWQRVGPPTWKRSGTLIFSAVMGVLLIGGTAMAANLGLLAFSASGGRGHRLEVPRPPLSVTLPTTESTPPTVDSTSVPDDVEETDDDVDDDDTDDDDTDGSPAGEGSTTEHSDVDADDETGSTSDPDDAADDDDDADDAADDDADDDDNADDAADDDDNADDDHESAPDLNHRGRTLSGAPGGKAAVSGANSDGRLDDD